jgi:hypothetical protein
MKSTTGMNECKFIVRVHYDHLRARQTFWLSGTFVETNLYHRFPGLSIICGGQQELIVQSFMP